MNRPGKGGLAHASTAHLNTEFPLYVSDTYHIFYMTFVASLLRAWRYSTMNVGTTEPPPAVTFSKATVESRVNIP